MLIRETTPATALAAWQTARDMIAAYPANVKDESEVIARRTREAASEVAAVFDGSRRNQTFLSGLQDLLLDAKKARDSFTLDGRASTTANARLQAAYAHRLSEAVLYACAHAINRQFDAVADARRQVNYIIDVHENAEAERFIRDDFPVMFFPDTAVAHASVTDGLTALSAKVEAAINAA